MSFIQIQILIFLSILICSLIGGKKSSLIASLVWLIETFIVYKESRINGEMVKRMVEQYESGLK